MEIVELLVKMFFFDNSFKIHIGPLELMYFLRRIK